MAQLTDFQVEACKFAGQAAIAVGGAFLAAFIASRRFRTERWWERKATAYGELIDALHAIKWQARQHYNASIVEKTVPDEEAATLREAYKEGMRNLWRITEAHTFLVSKEVLQAVRDLENDLEGAQKVHTFQEYLDEEIGAVNRCLERVKEIGRRDLRVK